MKKIHTLKCQTKHYGRVYEYDFDLGRVKSLLKKGAWYWDVIDHLIRLSNLRPNARGTVNVIKYSAKLLADDVNFCAIANVGLSELNNLDVYRFAYRFEEHLECEEFSQNKKSTFSSEFLRIICLALKDLPAKEKISRYTLSFSSRFTRDTKKTQLLSDLTFLNTQGASEAPIGAISHESYSELFIKAKEKISKDLKRVVDGCVKDLEWFAGVRNKIKQLMSMEVPPALERLIRDTIHRNTLSESVLLKRGQYTSKEIVAAYFQIFNESGGLNREVGTFNLPEMVGHLNAVFPGASDYATALRFLLTVPYQCPGQELLSIYTLILCHSGWNPGGLVHMTVDGISKVGGRWELQGFKEKTDDDTPVAILDKSKKGANEAIKRLKWHRQRLIDDGFIDESEKRLWFAGTNLRGFAMPNVDLVERKYFFRRHGLPKFSFSQIRSQVIELERLNGRAIESIRRRSGHKSINTTVGYLDNLINRRMFSSINLEFQKRLEDTVLFRLDESGVFPNKEYELDSVRPELVRSIGDGAYCLAPTAPPANAVLDNGVCSALTCHAAGGCPNRKIVITSESLEALARRRRYYVDNWERLESSNPAAFKEFHYDAMVHVLTLYKFVQDSTYRAFLENIEERLLG